MQLRPTRIYAEITLYNGSMRDGRVTEVFEDAQFLFGEAVREVDAGKLRNAAEKAWGATKRATDALILERTGEEPETSAITTRELHRLAGHDAAVDALVGRYHTRASYLHGLCFYQGMCEPEDEVERRIRETQDYIRDAQELAG